MRDDITNSQAERFWSKVEPFVALDACWLWNGPTHHGAGDYGEFDWRFGGRRMNARAHRLAYEMLVGLIPDGLTIDHLCLTTLCVNPDHMEPVTAGENVRRKRGGLPMNANGLRVCWGGHEISGGNAKPDGDGRAPRCRQCHNDAYRRRVEFRALAA